MKKLLQYVFLLLSMAVGIAQGAEQAADKGIWAKITANRGYLLGAASLGSSAALYSVARKRGCSKEEIAFVAGAVLFAPIFSAEHSIALYSDVNSVLTQNALAGMERPSDALKACEEYRIRTITQYISDWNDGLRNSAFVTASILVPASIGILCWLKGEKASQPIT